MPLSPLLPSDPQRLGDYWLAGRLGSGGQGVVYEGYGEDGRRVAIKVPRLDSSLSRHALAREVRALRRVASFCTAEVVEARVDEAGMDPSAQPYIVSEYIPGRTLRRVVEEAGPYEAGALRRLAIGVATGLAAIHEAGIVHRDLKPDNIVIGPDGPRLIDFGLARTDGFTPTSTGPLMGSPNYLAPEVYSGGRARACADLWSWALVVLFASLGHDAIPGGEPVEVMGRVLRFEPELGHLPEDLRDLVSRALARDPQARPTARAVLLRLLNLPESGAEALLAAGGREAAEVAGRPAAVEPDLGSVAEELYRELSEREREVAPEVFLRLVAVTGDGETAVRPFAKEELLDSRPGPWVAAATSLISVYGAAGLLADDDGELALCHPALVTAWPRLRDWVAEDHEGLALVAGVTTGARQWDRNGRHPADLVQGDRLDRVLRWFATGRRHLALTRLEREYLDAGSAQVRRRTRVRRAVTATLALLLAVSLGAVAFAERQRRTAVEQGNQALSRVLAARADDVRADEPAVGMLLSVAAWRTARTVEAWSSLVASAAQVERALLPDPDQTTAGERIWSGDRTTYADVSHDSVRIVNAETGRQVGAFAHTAEIPVHAALDHHGRMFAARAKDGIRLWDAATGKPVGVPFAPGWCPESFSRSGALAVLTACTDPGRWRLWDMRAREPVRTWSGVTALVPSPDDRHVVVQRLDGSSQAWSRHGGATTTLARGRVSAPDEPSAAFSGDGRLLAVGAGESVRLLRAGSWKPVREDIPAPLVDLALDADGGFLAGAEETTLTLWRVEDGTRLLSYPTSPVSRRQFPQPAFTADGRRLVFDRLSGLYGTLVLDVEPLTRPPSLPGTGDCDPAGDGERLLLVCPRPESRRVELLRLPYGKPAGPVIDVGELQPEAELESWSRALLSRDGGTLLLDLNAEAQSRLVFWDLARWRPGRSLRLPGASPETIAVSTDGRLLATASGSPRGPVVELWDVARGVRTRTFGLTDDVARQEDGTRAELAEFSPDGTTLAVHAGNRTALLRLGTGQVLWLDRRPILDLAFSPDGRTLATAGYGPVVLWDTRTGRRAGRPLAGGDRVVFSPDGRLLAAVEEGDYRKARLWHLASGRQLGPVVASPAEFTSAIAFDARGAWLTLTGPSSGERATLLTRHVVDPDLAVAQACARAGRELTPEEWRRYAPELAPERLCARR
ncbi:protein kinase domain-containing protein [Thermoactinospora rubra]|uniref:protein kinase domain-containing protein n=1 Tax=Thermoactinospora rubra TaxID=1088767 RepID=UPI00117F6514|nr:serine/threonine-protein kinase [Thermoactinospora rubra]